MTRRICALVALVALGATVLAGQASAKHTLAHKVGLLSAKLSCLQKYPVRVFEDYAFYELGNSSVPVLTAGDDPDEVNVLLDNDAITALDFNFGAAGPAHRRVLPRGQAHALVHGEVQDGWEPGLRAAPGPRRSEAGPPRVRRAPRRRVSRGSRR